MISDDTIYFSISLQLDLATKGTLNIQAVHASVSPRHSCFRVITDSDTIYASCGSAEELTKWVSGLVIKIITAL